MNQEERYKYWDKHTAPEIKQWLYHRDNMYQSFLDTPREILSDLRLIGLPDFERFCTVSGTLGRIIFLNDYGLVVRFESMILTPIDHPSVLQPILRLERSSGYTLEVLPAIPVLTPSAKQKVFNLGRQDKSLQNQLFDTLKKDGYFFYDYPQPENCGYLPHPDDPDTMAPIVLDRNAVKLLSDQAQTVSQHLPDLQKPFVKLKAAFQAAAKKQSRQELGDAFALSRDMKQKGELVCGWNLERQFYKTLEAKEAAKTYQPLVAAHHKKIFGSGF